MKLEDARKAYYDYSGTLSNINRQLALSGVAIVWFLFIQIIMQILTLALLNGHFF